MNLRQSPIIEILGMTMAAVTVVTSAGMLLKHELQDLPLADRSPVLEDVTAFGDDSIVLDEVKVADFRIVGVSIRSALDELLERTDPRLDYMVRSEMLLITTRAYAESDENLTVRIYNIGHLITPSADSVRSGGGVSRSGSALPTGQQLAQWVVETTAPPARWFDIDGEGGRLKIHNRMLIVRQSRRAHLAISDLLEQLTEHRSLLQQ